MDLNELFAQCGYFGTVLSLLTFWIGSRLQKRFKLAVLNPLLISMILCILFLLATGIDFEVYSAGAKILTWFLTPVTVCLAVPLYKQFLVLKQNLAAVAVGIVAGCAANLVVIIAIMALCCPDRTLTVSLLPKSITTAIALGVCEEAGGIQSVTVIGISVAGLFGAVFGPGVLKLLKVKEPVAQGLALGTASHAIGTSKAVELGEIQGAMSSLAIVVNGILTAVVIPLVVNWL